MLIKELLHHYSRWDGTQKVDLRWEKLTDELLDRFLKTGDLAFAMEWLLRQGHDFGPDGPVMQGLNKLVENLMKLRRDILSSSNISGLAEEMRRRLDEIINTEKEALKGAFEQAQRRYNTSGDQTDKLDMEKLFSQETFLDGLPANLKGAIEKLKDYKWQSQEAEQRFQELVNAIRQIQEIASRNWFTGDRPMTLEETVEAARRLKRISELIDALEQGRLFDIDLEQMAELLGEDARRSIEMMMQFMEFLHKEGFIRSGEEEWELTPKAVRRIAQRALKDIYAALHADTLGGHETTRAGLGEPVMDRPKPYEFGDPLNVDHKATMIESMIRNRDVGTPIKIEPKDFMVASTEYRSTSATVLLLDMSLSMVREGRFAAAKKVAIALDHLVRTRFARDKFFVVGFATVAKQLRSNQLANARGALGGDIFTNIQDALRLASKLLAQSGARNKQIILVTDGQPTAYSMGGELHVEWPVFGVSPNAEKETLKEIKKVTEKGITINTFMLDASPELMRFVDMMTRINKGRAFYTTPDTLGQYLLVDFVKRRKKVLH